MKQILVYADSGVSAGCYEQTVRSLREEVDGNIYSVRPFDAQQLLKTDWESGTSLLVIPGGRDLPYQQKLSPDGTRRIRDFVKQGGSYLGLCAGAYFGAQEIVFEKGGDLEVCAQRDLAFFPGKAVGPAYGTGRFRYDCDADIEAASITWRAESEEILCHAFFYGGCFFENPALYPHIKILATYGDLPGNPAAAVYCPIEKGRAVLSGVHLEYSVQDWAGFSTGHLRIRPLLLASEKRRRRCFRSLLYLLEIINDKSVKNILL